MDNNTNAITQLEQTLLRILKEEYSFYQSLYILLDKQRDVIQFDRDENLLDLGELAGDELELIGDVGRN